MLEKVLGKQTTTTDELKQKVGSKMATSYTSNFNPNSRILASSNGMQQYNPLTWDSITSLKTETNPNNDFHDMQELYLKSLEEQYVNLKNMKKAKKFKLLREIRLI